MTVESDNGRDLSPSGQSILQKSWPYVVFFLFVAAYSYLFLADGFNATDEGYLQSMAQRIVNGELLYVDFYFFRPPMSLYLQAALLWLFGDNYTILAARWFWTAEMVVVVLLLSVVYRRHVGRPIELFLLLCASWIVSSMLIGFPWYSYDAFFFAAVSLVLVCRRQWFLAGLAMFLAGMAKQNYMFLLPGYVSLAALLQWRFRQADLLNGRILLKLLIGWVAPAVVFIGYLSWYGGGLEAFIWNVFVMPRKTAGIDFTFAIFQDNAAALWKSLPVIVAAVSWSFSDSRRWFLIGLATVASALAVVIAFEGVRIFVYELVYLNYTLLAIALGRALLSRDQAYADLWRTLLPLVAMGAVIQYLAGFNYAGLIFSYMGAAPGLVAGWLLFRSSDRSRYRQVVSLALLLVIIGGGLAYKLDFMERDDKRWRLDAEFTTPKLAGIRSTKRNVELIDALTQAVELRTEPDDYILAFPDLPAIYYLTNRRNPTRIGWYVMKEFTSGMLDEALDQMTERRPRLIMLQKYSENDFMRVREPLAYWRYRRYRPMYEYLQRNYRPAGVAGDVQLLAPVGTGP